MVEVFSSELEWVAIFPIIMSTMMLQALMVVEPWQILWIIEWLNEWGGRDISAKELVWVVQLLPCVEEYDKDTPLG